MESEIIEFIRNFLKERGDAGEGLKLHLLPGDGSRRSFWRITVCEQKSGFIAMANPPIDRASKRENVAYLAIGSHLRKRGIQVPEIYEYDFKTGWFVMEDVGDTNLQDLLSSKEDPIPIYEEVLKHLLRLQVEGAKGFKSEWCCQTQTYDRTVMRRYEADYFRHSFLYHYLGLKKEWPELEGPFDHLADTASKAENRFFLHRDFQSRNIMISEGKIGIIDWQGGRFGPLAYDIASLLIDPYTNLLREQREKIYMHYIELLKEIDAGRIDSFKKYFPYLAIQRSLQILGAFSHLTKAVGKMYFEAYIPNALITLHNLLCQLNDTQLFPLSDLVKGLQPDKKSFDNPGLMS